jgi:hypothetical protein
MGDATSTVTDSSFCNQLSIRQQYNIPLPRFDLNSVNPYLFGYTKQQLDMRRKVETLKFSSNKSSTQTNNLTKQQKFALLVRGGLPTPSQAALKRGNSDCESDETMPTPTSACGVPGPITYLQYDKSIPLYNYSDFNTRTYPSYVPDNNSQWQFVVFPDVVIDNKRPENIYYLIINNRISQSKNVYNVTTPTAITFSGSIPNPSIYLGKHIQISIVNAILSVYYIDNLVNRYRSTNAADASLNVLFGASGQFIARQFLGSFAFDGLSLYTEPTYMYSFKISVTFAISSDEIANFDQTAFIDGTQFSYSLIANNTNTVTENANTNCVVTNLNGTYVMGASITSVE